MSRLAKNVVLVSKPIRTFPNGDYFYVELSRKSTLYHCAVMMSCAGKPLETVVVAKSQGKTIREAEDAAYSRAIDRCPGFPRPPYLHRRPKETRVMLAVAKDHNVPETVGSKRSS